MFRLVLFDIDGTLISTEGAGVKAFAQTSAELYGLPEATKGMTFAGRTDRALVELIFNQNSIEITEAKVKQFFKAYLERLNHFLPTDNTTPLPGVMELMEKIRQSQSPPVIGLLTGNHSQGAQLKLKHYNIWDEFEMGAFGDKTTERNAVAQEALAWAKERWDDIKPEEILVIGDTERDIQCARSIGAKVLAVATGHSSIEELQAFDPDWASIDLLAENLPQFGLT
jgi:phosphoglycolate phosphatase-like HAD superfamily hydrolase